MSNRRDNVALGNLIGGSSYFGQCGWCGRQFMSTHDRVWTMGDHTMFCSAECRDKGEVQLGAYRASQRAWEFMREDSHVSKGFPFRIESGKWAGDAGVQYSDMLGHTYVAIFHTDGSMTDGPIDLIADMETGIC